MSAIIGYDNWLTTEPDSELGPCCDACNDTEKCEHCDGAGCDDCDNTGLCLHCVPESRLETARLDKCPVILVTVDGDEVKTTLGEFIRDNSDCMAPDDVEELQEAVFYGRETAKGGGGAAPEWSVRRA